MQHKNNFTLPAIFGWEIDTIVDRELPYIHNMDDIIHLREIIHQALSYLKENQRGTTHIVQAEQDLNSMHNWLAQNHAEQFINEIRLNSNDFFSGENIDLKRYKNNIIQESNNLYLGYVDILNTILKTYPQLNQVPCDLICDDFTNTEFFSVTALIHVSIALTKLESLQIIYENSTTFDRSFVSELKDISHAEFEALTAINYAKICSS